MSQYIVNKKIDVFPETRLDLQVVELRKLEEMPQGIWGWLTGAEKKYKEVVSGYIMNVEADIGYDNAMTGAVLEELRKALVNYGIKDIRMVNYSEYNPPEEVRASAQDYLAQIDFDVDAKTGYRDICNFIEQRLGVFKKERAQLFGSYDEVVPDRAVFGEQVARIARFNERNELVIARAIRQNIEQRYGDGASGITPDQMVNEAAKWLVEEEGTPERTKNTAQRRYAEEMRSHLLRGCNNDFIKYSKLLLDDVIPDLAIWIGATRNRE